VYSPEQVTEMGEETSALVFSDAREMPCVRKSTRAQSFPTTTVFGDTEAN
jgi:hypothetical protein